MNVLVTGGSGFLGKALCKKLHALGHSVSYLSRTEASELKDLNIKWFQGDISNAAIAILATKNQNAVFHTAALAGYWGKREDYFKTNVLGTENIVNSCINNQVPHLIFTSSPSIVFNGKDLENVDESIGYPEKHLCFYSETKCLAEKLVLKNNTRELKTISLRPHLIYGPGDNHLIPRVISSAKDSRLRIVGYGRNKVDMIYIDNAVQGHIDAWYGLINMMDCAGKSYFISDDAPIELWPWVNNLLAELSIPQVKKKVSYAFAYRLGACMEKIYKWLALKGEPRMTRFLAQSLGKHHYFDCSNAKRDFNYKVVVSSEEAFRRTIIDLHNKRK